MAQRTVSHAITRIEELKEDKANFEALIKYCQTSKESKFINDKIATINKQISQVLALEIDDNMDGLF